MHTPRLLARTHSSHRLTTRIIQWMYINSQVTFVLTGMRNDQSFTVHYSKQLYSFQMEIPLVQ